MEQAKLKRFGGWVRARRRELGLTLAETQQAGGPSDKKLGEIERGDAIYTPNRDTLAKIDVALKWRPGSSAAALHGGVPPIPINESVYTEEEVRRRVMLELALERAGVRKVAARNHEDDQSVRLSGEVIDQVIEILNSLPPEKSS